MNSPIDMLKAAIEPLRQEIIHHPVYDTINSVDDLRIFMNYHIYAVWDFMSLLKSLQNKLTCTQVPWFPVGSANTRYLVNEIVAGEESDTDRYGNRKSHYELYLDAMASCGADPEVFLRFIDELRQTASLEDAFGVAGVPEAAREFVRYTFEIIGTDKDFLQAAVFTFGREDLIPGMFVSMVDDLNEKFPGQLADFKYYLDRHIEVDGGHHSNLALEMTAGLCGADPQKWRDAEQACITALRKRISLWDGAYQEIIKAAALTEQ